MKPKNFVPMLQETCQKQKQVALCFSFILQLIIEKLNKELISLGYRYSNLMPANEKPIYCQPSLAIKCTTVMLLIYPQLTSLMGELVIQK
jgi:hypothetical protein